MVIELSNIDNRELLNIAKKYDTDKDGKLDESESVSLFSYIKQERNRYAPCSDADRIPSIQCLVPAGAGIIIGGGSFIGLGKLIHKLSDIAQKSPSLLRSYGALAGALALTIPAAIALVGLPFGGLALGYEAESRSFQKYIDFETELKSLVNRTGFNPSKT